VLWLHAIPPLDISFFGAGSLAHDSATVTVPVKLK
jgi:hypothetical protein